MKNKTKTKSKTAKVFSIISLVLLVLCASILIYSTISYSQRGLVTFFNYSFHVIQTKSMEPDIKAGDLAIVKSVPFDEIHVGDDILFKCEDPTSAVYGRYIVHRVKELTETPGVYKTYGINNHGIEDKVLSKAEGKVVKVSSSWGAVFSFLTSWKSIILIVAFAGIIVFMIFEVVSVVQNASKLKQEKDKNKLEGNEQLKEQLKGEVLKEIEKEKQQKEDDLKEQKNEEKQDETQTNNKKKSKSLKQNNITKNEDGSDKKWNTL